ncbi:amino acid adenylation domain-containing protein [Arenibacter sp. S6351L]|uniref:amino acid adenylation domain-containing protein n=1 Tax=Arenibacter sp. S6351L TaxID=2926407 RepID=UPI001FF12079|nr:amino acid adenylation domain-containing protein [Arenibacter sp. S6351L]MCK0137087.1 amino acid adenylation domain-containing protein [Arenibacter sp. S6351L]
MQTKYLYSHPLTQSQELIWMGQKMNPNVPLYNVPYAFEINGNISERDFELAMQALIDRTQILRTIFYEENGTVAQKVLTEFSFQLEKLDFTRNPNGPSVKEWLKKKSEINFDFSQPLFDTAILKIDEEKYIWYLNLHHLITDATTAVLIFNLMGDLYKGVQDKNVANAPFPAAYKNFIEFEAEKRSDPNHIKQSNYWKKKVKNFASLPHFYGSKQKVITTQAKRVQIGLGKQRTQKLKELTRNPNVGSLTTDMGLFTLFSTLIHIYLYRISGQSKILVGSPIHNRISRDFKFTPGLFVELFPMSLELNEEDTFATAIEKMKLEMNEFLRNAQISSSSAEVSRGFNAVLNYINTVFPGFNGFPTNVEWIHPNHCDPLHQLRCHIIDFNGKGELEILFDLNQEVFDDSLAELVPHHFLNLLDGLLTNLDQPICAPPLITQNEKTQLLGDMKTSETDLYKGTFLEQFEKTVRNNPEKIALENGEDLMSYLDLNNRANQLAHFLIKNGIKESEKVALHLYRSPDYIISTLALMKIGATFIPIPADQPEGRIKFVISSSECVLVITEKALKKNIAANTKILDLLEEREKISSEPITSIGYKLNRSCIAYYLYTSGSTGMPKGVMVSHKALNNYLQWASTFYNIDTNSVFPLFTSIGFDLTISATFLPLMNGGKVVVYREGMLGPDISLIQVLDENKVNSIKITPAHISLMQVRNLEGSKIKTMIVGGEDLKVGIAKSIYEYMGKDVTIFNEYGPTEATVGCIVCKFNPEQHQDVSVPIGKVIDNMNAYILDINKNLVPKGVVGELFLGGDSLAEGYANLQELTKQKFINDPFRHGSKMYRTGDLVRINNQSEMEYLGRNDEQVKLNGFRIELADIEANLLEHTHIDNASVVLLDGQQRIAENEVINCTECGLPSNYPKIDFDEKGVCHLCNAFKGYKEKTDKYFKTEEELQQLLLSTKGSTTTYDCLSLLSGGKDSTYVLARLINMGLKVLAFTLDNGYISDQAKANVDKIVKKLGVDHVYGSTVHMNKIFVDSLERHQNVCNGCFKTIYTLSTKVALDKKIPFVVTGLSRGQFFETRLTEELFWNDNVDTNTIDRTILEARKLYHQENDAVNQLLDVSMFKNEETFDKVQFVDFYRYSDVSLEEMLVYLKEKVGWVRPTDTGRSTNCLINQLGIYVHKKQKGYSNYSFPYSWDVRLGHKTRAETLEEINEYIDENEVKRIMGEIGYVETNYNDKIRPQLVGYYTAKTKIPHQELIQHLSKRLPSYMLPNTFKYLETLPLTSNGKVDKKALRSLNIVQLQMDTPYAEPNNEIEILLEQIWREVLLLDKIGMHDNFIALGGHSLAAIRVTARINEEVEMNFPLNKIFELPTIAEYAKYIEETLLTLMEE